MPIRIVEPASAERKIRIIEPAAGPARGQSRSIMDEISGAMANVNRGLGIGDELAAAGNTVVNATRDGLQGKQGPGLIDRFQGEMKRQRGIEDDFMARRPMAGNFAKGAGMAATVLAPGPTALRAIGGGTRMAAATRGAVAAAIPAYAYGLADRGNGLDRLKAANLNAAVAAPFGAIGGAIAGRGARQPAPDLAVQRERAIDALDELGVRPEAMAEDATQQIDDLLRAGHSPQDAAIAVAARSLPEPVPMTTGQITGEPGQQLAENLALRGADGPEAAYLMQNQQRSAQDALRGNVTAMAEQFGGGTPAMRGDAGAAVSGRLNAMRETANDGVNAAYTAARNAGEGVTMPRQEVPPFAARLRESVRDYDPQTIPAVARQMARLDDLGGSTQVRDVFEIRAQLSTLRRDGERIEASAAGNVIRELDGFIDDAMTRDLFSGDTQAIGAWRNAIRQRREFGNLFESDDLIAKLTEPAYRGGGRTLAVDPVDASNYIFGRADMGYVGKQNLTRDMTRLRDTLGADSAEWNAIRSEAFTRIAGTGEGAMEGGTRMFSGVKFAKAWEDFNRKSPTLVRTLFTPDEISRVNQFSTVAARTTNPVKGGDNSSNTATAAKKLLMGMKFAKAVPFLKDIVEMSERGVATRQIRSAVSGQLPQARALPRLPGPGLRLGSAQAIGAGSNANGQSR